MTYNSPKGEHAGKTGTNWHMRAWSTGEQVVLDEDEDGVTVTPIAPRLNREQRRKAAKALRRAA